MFNVNLGLSIDRPFAHNPDYQSGPADGKSTIAVNLAYTTRSKPSYPDADLRRPNVHTVGIKRKWFGSIFVEEISLKDALHP